jgi:hypothetical protein
LTAWPYRWRAASPDVPTIAPIAAHEWPSCRARTTASPRCRSAGQDRVAYSSECCGVAYVCGLGLFEAGGELVGMVEELLSGAGHGDHLMYFGRAGGRKTTESPAQLGSLWVSVNIGGRPKPEKWS